MSNEISKRILEDMLDYSVALVKYVEKQRLPRSIVDQVTRSSTSIGANYAEAQDASSKKDFASKIYIAKKESAETSYWLKFIEKYLGTSKEISVFIDKAQKFTMTLQKILVSLREKS